MIVRRERIVVDNGYRGTVRRVLWTLEMDQAELQSEACGFGISPKPRDKIVAMDSFLRRRYGIEDKGFDERDV